MRRAAGVACVMLLLSRGVDVGARSTVEGEAALLEGADDLRSGLARHEDVVGEVRGDEEDGAATWGQHAR